MSNMDKPEESEGDINPKSIIKALNTNLKKDIIKQVLQNNFEDNKTKISPEAMTVIMEIIKSMCTEACLRSINLSLQSGGNKVDIEQLEKCLPQLMLDFP